MRAPRLRRLAPALLALGAACAPLPRPLAASFAPAGEAFAAPAQDSVTLLLTHRLLTEGPGETPRAPELLRVYGERAFAPLWTGARGARPAADTLLRLLRAAAAEGLRPADYPADALAAEVARSRAGRMDAAARAALELRLGAAFLDYATHLGAGRVAPRAVHRHWNLVPRTPGVVGALIDVSLGAEPAARLALLAPPDPEYARLRAALHRYRALDAAGGWNPLPGGAALRPGDSGPGVAALRRRLATEGRVAADTSSRLDAALEAAVRAFQRTHGLEEDGVVGPATRAALDVPAAARVRQLEVAMERLRWLPDDPGPRYVRVGVPAFELSLVERGRTVLRMRVVGGRPDWPTPVFHAAMTEVVFAPYWNVPPRIAAQEVWPRQRRDPGYFAREGIRVLAGGRLRQDPGPRNPLGGVKFFLPNPHDVYLHDTSAPWLFARADRALSHGCMRVERPAELAVALLASPAWGPGAVRAAMGARRERRVALREPVAVYVLPRTAWVEEDGTVHFRPDRYGHDAALLRALDGGAVAAAAATVDTAPPTAECGAPARAEAVAWQAPAPGPPPRNR